MGKRRRENDIDEAPRSKRGSQADEEDDVFQITQGQSQEKDEPMDNFQDELEESGENGNYIYSYLVKIWIPNAEYGHL